MRAVTLPEDSISPLRPSHADQAFANSLFRNILPVKHLESGFCQAFSRCKIHNLKKTSILSDLRRKPEGLRFAANPLICNILRLKSLESIFCEAEKTLRHAN